MRPLTLDTILVATDLSTDDLPALRTAFELAQLAGAGLHVVHAGDGNDTDLVRRLDEHIRAADPPSDVLPGTTLRAGPPEQVIVDVAKDLRADVIVLGPHHADRSLLLDGTAYRVAANAGRPCLVLPGAMQLPLGRILVPIDASGAARGALAIGLTWASALRRRPTEPPMAPTELFVMHVATSDDGVAAAHSVMEDATAAVTDRTSAITGVPVQRIAENGEDAATLILDRSVTGDFDLIVLGTRAETRSADGLGSVSSAVVRSATRPVLLVPPRVWASYSSIEGSPS